MNYIEFRNKYNNHYVDFDNVYGPQCWDLAQFYFTQVLNVPSSVLSGCRWVGNMLIQPKRAELDQYFDEVDTHAMQQGDVCIWRNPKNEEDCHIAIYDHYENGQCYYFSQNPGPSKVQIVNKIGHHAFRRKQEKKEEITPNVPRDEYKNQIEVKVPDLRVRAYHSLGGDIIGKASKGFYDYYEVAEGDGYQWYRITDDWRRQWIASSDEWTTVYPKKDAPKKGDKVNIEGTFEVKDTNDNMVLVSIEGKDCWIPFKAVKIV